MEELWIFAPRFRHGRVEEIVQANRGRAESIRLDNVGPDAKIFFVDALDRLGACQKEDFMRAFEIFTAPIPEALAAVI